MEFDGTALRTSVEETWSSLFAMHPCALDEPIPHGVRKTFLSSIIQITGDWMGSVIIDYAPELARKMAGLFSDADPSTITFAEMRDVLGETVNIVAGHIKEHLPPNCQLSLPTVVAGLDYRLLVAGALPVSRNAFACEGAPFQLTIFELDPNAKGGTGLGGNMQLGGLGDALGGSLS